MNLWQKCILKLLRMEKFTLTYQLILIKILQFYSRDGSKWLRSWRVPRKWRDLIRQRKPKKWKKNQELFFVMTYQEVQQLLTLNDSMTLMVKLWKKPERIWRTDLKSQILKNLLLQIWFNKIQRPLLPQEVRRIEIGWVWVIKSQPVKWNKSMSVYTREGRLISTSKRKFIWMMMMMSWKVSITQMMR